MKEWSLQSGMQFMQFEISPEKDFQASTGLNPMSAVLQTRFSTN